MKYFELPLTDYLKSYDHIHIYNCQYYRNYSDIEMIDNISILSEKDLNLMTTKQPENDWLKPHEYHQLKQEFHELQIKLLTMFTTAKSDLQSIYRKVVINVKQIINHLNKTNTKVERGFKAVLAEVTEEIQYKLGNLTENLKTILVDEIYFEELKAYLESTSNENIESKTPKIHNTSYSSSNKLLPRPNNTVVQIDAITTYDYAKATKIQLNCKSIEQTGWLSGKWENLQYMDLSRKRLNNIIPLVTCVANKLKQMNLNDNQIKCLDFMKEAQYPHLVTLRLKNNRISDIKPLAQASLLSLEKLQLNQNRIKSINPLVQANFPNLIELNVAENKIEKIECFTHYQFLKLQLLNLDKNHIKTLDALLTCRFPQLKILSFSFNQIRTLDCLTNCRFIELEGLMGYNNQIESIESLRYCNFPNLRELLLNDNLIKDISVVEKLPFSQLKELDLENNMVKHNQILCITTKKSSFYKAKKKYPFILL